MLCDDTKRDLRTVLDILGDGDRGAWDAIAALSKLGRSGTEISIDFSTVAALGAPVIIARLVPPALSGLTPRQSEVAACLGEGLSNKQIARRLGISPATVKDHVHAILTVTGAKSRAEVIVALHGP